MLRREAPEVVVAHRKPKSLAAFSFRIRGCTSSRKPAFAKSAIHRSVVIIGWSEPKSILFFSSVFAYCTRIGGKYFGDQPERSIYTAALCSAMARASSCHGNDGCAMMI